MHETEYMKFKVADEDDFYNINEHTTNLEKIDLKFKELENPQYELPKDTEDEKLKSGENFFKALGKLAKAVNVLITHKTLEATNKILGHVKLANVSMVTEEGYAADARQLNPSVEGSLANQVSGLDTLVKKHGEAISSLNTDMKNLPTLNGQNQKIKICAGTALVQYNSNTLGFVTLKESFNAGTASINFLSTDAILANSFVRNNTLEVLVYPQFANTQIYTNYIVIGF